MMSASPTGPATLSRVPWPVMPMWTRAWYTPHTVPNRPTNGAVLPIDARTVSPRSTRAVSSSRERWIARVRTSDASTPCSREAPRRAATACRVRRANESPFANRFLRRLVQAGRPARALDFDAFRGSAGADVDAQRNLALLAVAPRQRRVGGGRIAQVRRVELRRQHRRREWRRNRRRR